MKQYLSRWFLGSGGRREKSTRCGRSVNVYRMWGGCVAIDEIATGLTELRKQGFMEISS